MKATMKEIKKEKVLRDFYRELFKDSGLTLYGWNFSHSVTVIDSHSGLLDLSGELLDWVIKLRGMVKP